VALPAATDAKWKRETITYAKLKEALRGQGVSAAKFDQAVMSIAV